MTAPNTPGQRVANPQAPLAGASDASGSTIRAVYDPSSTIAAGFHCLAPVGDDNCHLTPRHRGSCLALPSWPHTDITRENPSSSSRSTQ